jgi:N-acetylglutamate synthase-like GNAT family acetyltransferase
MFIRKASSDDINEMSLAWADSINSSNLDRIRTTFTVFLKLGECLVVEEGGEVIGTGCYISYSHLSWIGNVGIKKSFQRKGYGRKLMVDLLGLIRTESIRLDATEAGYGLYKRLGFSDGYKTIAFDISDVKGVNDDRVKITNRLEDWMLELDKEAFGDDRSKLLLNIKGKVIYTQGGYGVIYSNILGPLIAENDEVAERLIRSGVRLGVSGVITTEDKEYFIRKLGGKKVGECVRMTKGKEVKENRRLIYGIFRYAFG